VSFLQGHSLASRRRDPRIFGPRPWTESGDLVDAFPAKAGIDHTGGDWPNTLDGYDHSALVASSAFSTKWRIFAFLNCGWEKPGDNPTHDTAQSHAHWTRNPFAAWSLDQCAAAWLCDARVPRRPSLLDAPHPSFRWMPQRRDAGGSALHGERQAQGNISGCWKQPRLDIPQRRRSPHGEQHGDSHAPVEPRGRA